MAMKVFVVKVEIFSDEPFRHNRCCNE